MTADCYRAISRITHKKSWHVSSFRNKGNSDHDRLNMRKRLWKDLLMSQKREEMMKKEMRIRLKMGKSGTKNEDVGSFENSTKAK